MSIIRTKRTSLRLNDAEKKIEKRLAKYYGMSIPAMYRSLMIGAYKGLEGKIK